MGDLKPLGSEKLKGDEKLKRILELAYYNKTSNVNESTNNYEYIVESNNGCYGIVKEKDGYYVKKGLNESTLNYIGGLFMKNKNKFPSYAEALKRLELLKGQEEINEATKYVLKTKSPESKTNVSSEMGTMTPEPELPTDTSSSENMDDMGTENNLDLPVEPDDEFGSDDDGFGDDENTETGETGLKMIQKLTGRLGEKLRSLDDELESKDLKYVLNSVISAIDLTKLDEEDMEDVLSKFESEEMDSDDKSTFNDETDTELPNDETDTELPNDETDSELPNEDELGEMRDLEDLINSEFDFENDDIEGYDNVEEKPEQSVDEDENFSAYLATADSPQTQEDNEYEVSENFNDEMYDDFEDENVREFDIDEIRNIVNKVINDNLQNYFK